MSWTDEQLETIRVRVTNGDNYTDIGQEFGRTRHAISGLAYRHRAEWGIKPQKNGSRRKTTEFWAGEARQAARKPSKAMRRPKSSIPLVVVPKPISPPLAPLEPCDPVRLSRRELNRCAFIEGEPTADALMCGRPVEHGYSWCSFHRQRVFAVREQ